MLLINILGGAAVLGSYTFGILAHPNASQVLWGEVPESIHPFYIANMLRQQWAILLYIQTVILDAVVWVIFFHFQNAYISPIFF